MDKNRLCKICGKKVLGCNSCEDKVFNWKNIACCYEHAIEYMSKILEERNKKDDG